MALTRKQLKAMGLEDDKIEMIIEAHTETVDALKQQAEEAKASAAPLAGVIKERDQLKQELEALKGQAGDAAKVQAAFDAYKTQVEGEKVAAARAAAVQAVLEEQKLRPSAVKALMKVIDMDTVQVLDGKLQDAEKLLEPLKAEYADFFATENTQGTPPTTPPSGKQDPVDPFTQGFMNG